MVLVEATSVVKPAEEAHLGPVVPRLDGVEAHSITVILLLVARLVMELVQPATYLPTVDADRSTAKLV